MEQDYTKSGLSLKDLNPMYYWQFVMKNTYERVPCIVLKNLSISEITTIATEHPDIDFVVENYNENSFPKNVLVKDKTRITNNDRVRQWSITDYLISNGDLFYELEAGLCGVKVIPKWEEIDFHVLTPVERIDNWENAKILLTKKF